MYHKPLVTHVTNKLKEGVPLQKVEADLAKDGWSKDDIRQAFYYTAHSYKLRRFSLVRLLSSEVPAIVTALLILFIVAGSGLSFFFFNKITLSYDIALPSVPESGHVALAYGEQEKLADPDFFGDVKNQLVEEKVSFIEANLSTLQLRVYKDGELALEVPIDTKGREGSWWETPAGLYKIQNKEDAHFSTMGHVWMPWSMNFQGNFFIHGRTYYDDGTLTSASYTGGCIRLSTDDAKKVYDISKVGMPVLVFEDSFSSDSFEYRDKLPTDISATAYLAVDINNGRVFASKESTKEVPIASITKLMTALVATEYINLDAIATVPKDALVYTSKSRLAEGERHSVYQLLFPLLMESSNEAAETIARHYGRERFIKYMNDKADSIGMKNTNFDDPSGASALNTSTAEDLFMLARYIYNNRSFVFHITSGSIKSSAYGASEFPDLGNFNDFVDNEFFFGGKNGQTLAAKETNLSVFEFTAGTTTRPVVSIVLGAENAKNESELMLGYLLSYFR
ncbi:L,D-transpeptidase family protein [Patescibacteria group bacterium]|nr:L,D-transpeptidase family protein [Patescibacteria group bacterium]